MTKLKLKIKPEERAWIAAECVATCTRFFNALDAADYDRLLREVTPEVVWERGGQIVSGIEAVREVLSRRPAGRVTCHLLCNADVELVGPREARVRYCLVALEQETPAHPAKGSVRMAVDELRRSGDAWRIAHKRSATVLLPLSWPGPVEGSH